MTISFTKMQGLGNDFVVLDGVRQTLHLTPKLIGRMADRHFGIGFDQLLLVEPPSQDKVDFNYRIFNADGSEIGQCGNGARCVGRFLVESGLVAPEQTHILLATKTRVLEVQVREANQVMVNMGVPEFEPIAVPFQATERTQDYTIQLRQQTIKAGVVSMGNPHAVLWVEDVSTAPVGDWGVELAQHARFPEGVNAGFAQRLSRSKICLRVYERGAGETLACGSGACAAVVVGNMQGLLDPAVEVALPGGKLEISWHGEGSAVWMTGPAEVVFQGQWLGGE